MRNTLIIALGGLTALAAAHLLDRIAAGLTADPVEIHTQSPGEPHAHSS